MKIAIIGAGAWGTALAASFGRSSEVALFSANSELVLSIKQERENKRYLPGVMLPDSVQVTESLVDALRPVSGIVLAVPTRGLRSAIKACQEQNWDQAPYLVTCKGFEVGSGLLPFQVVEEMSPKVQYGILSGPSFAKDVGARKPTIVSLASPEESSVGLFSDLLLRGDIRTYFNNDLIGVSVGGAGKNVIAIAAGMSDALGLGASALAGLVTRGLSEISKVGIALGAKPQTFMGLSGMGDLALTCFSDLSRNRRLGYALGRGKSVEEAEKALGQVAEGIHAAHEIKSLAARFEVDVPITSAITRILSDQISPNDVAKELFARAPKSEI
ncbi:NAD(P)-dependent glycerol-3-phosphate dehydrogenase [Burkholderiales bacterium]|nr:NAD(P)-dependent glycerol-3-phosphate dehydrogenase [Burkholderiales bacterium]